MVEWPGNPVQFPKLDSKSESGPSYSAAKETRRNAKFMLSIKRKHTNSSEESLFPVLGLKELSCPYTPVGDGLAMWG